MVKTASNAGCTGRSLARELRSRMPHGTAKKNYIYTIIYRYIIEYIEFLNQSYVQRFTEGDPMPSAYAMYHFGNDHVNCLFHSLPFTQQIYKVWSSFYQT